MAMMIQDEDTSFVGRSAELDLIGAVLGTSRLVTLTGPGGVGKTRLARHALSRGTWADEDDLAWADLSPLRDADLLSATVADALGLSDHTPRMPTDAIRAWIGSRRTVLVLDCCEHLLAECRGLVADLLAACPRLRILATSRQPLKVRGETVVRIEPLATVQEALDLFADRAAATGNPLKDDTDHRLAATLCERLDRLPLALELAAAQLRAMPLNELCVRPRSAVDLPPAPPHTKPPRHAALRTTIGWSHELCTPLERLLWARLSFLPGAFDENTARQVATGGPLHPRTTAQTLHALCDKSVVTHRAGAYRMLDTVREYGRMWLSEIGEEQAVARRHAEHMLTETRHAHRAWPGPRQRSWYRRIDFLHADIRLATGHLLATDPAAALELLGHVTFYWVCSGYLYEARQHLEQAVRLLPDARPDEPWVQGLWSLGLTLTLQGEHDAALPVAIACRQAASAARDTEGSRRAAYLEGLLHLLQGRPLAAAHVVESTALGTAAPPPDQPTSATLLCRLLHVFALTASGRLRQARHEALELRDTCAELDEYWTRSYVDHQLALISLLEQDAQDAVRHARAALDAKQHIGDAFGIAMLMDLLGIALADTGQEREAAHAFGAADRFWETIGHPQRGTPELAALRDECEGRLVRALGDAEFDRIRARTAACDRRTLVRWASRGGPFPPG
ncbi:ATP-binding protein [Streptomyces sp. NPDC091280]|uniref:ATP-binding protein n=1 Tax=Streptomyces sp. NPDC091280 TaxID=3365984 RepID=UPI0038067C9E